MENFKTKYNYLIPLGRIFFGLFFLLLAITSVSMIPENFTFLTLILNLFLSIFLSFQAYRFFYLAIKETSNYTFEKSKIISRNILLGKKIIINNEDVNGFSTSIYPTRRFNKVITIYLKNGNKIELPQFLYFNYKKIENALINNSIKNYGSERYGQNFFTLSRSYEFD